MKTLKFKNIAVPFDFNTCFQHSLKMALEIANTAGAKITILNVLNPIYAAGGDYVVNTTTPLGGFKSIIEERHAFIEHFIKEQKLSADKVLIKVEIGSYCDNLITLNALYKFDLIVLPDLSQHPLERFYSGINPEEIKVNVQTPVLICNKYHPKAHEELLLMPVKEDSNWFDNAVYSGALARLMGFKVLVLGVTEPGPKHADKIEQNLAMSKDFLDKLKINYECESTLEKNRELTDVMLLDIYKSASLILLTPMLNYEKIGLNFNFNYHSN